MVGFSFIFQVKEWAKQFCLGRKIVEDEPREGQPVEMVTEENIAILKRKY